MPHQVTVVLFHVLATAYALAALFTFFHCIKVKKMRGKGRYAVGIILIPFLGVVLYWKNRVGVLTTKLKVATLNASLAPPKPTGRYASPPPPKHVPRYSTVPPFADSGKIVSTAHPFDSGPKPA